MNGAIPLRVDEYQTFLISDVMKKGVCHHTHGWSRQKEVYRPMFVLNKKKG